MRKTIYLIFTALFIFQCFCFCVGKKKERAKPEKDTVANFEQFETGKIIHPVHCKNDSTQNYAIYLPTSYKTDKKYPVIYAFDASARGVFPLKRYKDLAEKYDYILIGSNNSRNGLDPGTLNHMITILMDDTRSRLAIDPDRIYTTGFSGGGRVAATVGIETGIIRGVISCAAGFPQIDKPIANKFDYLAFVGDEDFNYSELTNLDKTLETTDFRHFLIVYEGKHDWAPASIFEDAFLWCEFNAMKDKLIPINDSLIKYFLKKQELEIRQFTTKGWLNEEMNGYKKITVFLNGIFEINKFNNKINAISNQSEYKNLLVNLEQFQKQEESGQGVYASSFSTKDYSWWSHEITSLNSVVNFSKNHNEIKSFKRSLAYIGLMAHLNYDNAMKNGATDQALIFLQIKNYAQPNEPVTAYLFSSYYAKLNQTDKALDYLQKAVNLGYDDIEKIREDGNFATLKSNPGFQKLVKNLSN